MGAETENTSDQFSGRLGLIFATIGAAIGTTQIALISNAYWFGAPVAKIHKEADKSPFTGRVGGAVGRFLERVPVLGKRLRARRETRIEKAEREVFGNDRGE